jgi:hypothetical protein
MFIGLEPASSNSSHLANRASAVRIMVCNTNCNAGAVCWSPGWLQALEGRSRVHPVSRRHDVSSDPVIEVRRANLAVDRVLHGRSRRHNERSARKSEGDFPASTIAPRASTARIAFRRSGGSISLMGRAPS